MCTETKVMLPQIPRAFIGKARINDALLFTLETFTYEEQAAICLYCLVGWSIDEIANVTEISAQHVEAALTLYAQRMTLAINIFKQAVSYDASDQVSVCTMYEIAHGVA